ncbi:MAG: serine/threonine-protein kinase [Planctomycetota bacterium]
MSITVKDKNFEKDFQFGRIALKNNLLTETQVADCLEVQKERRKQGIASVKFGSIVLAKGYMTRAQVMALLRAQKRLVEDHRRKGLQIPGYEILEVLGKGAVGTVFKAKQISMARLVALKVLHERWLDEEDFKKRFLMEARIVGQMSHQNLIQVYDFGAAANAYYFSMEYVDGPTVEDVIERNGPLPLTQAVDIIIQISRALNYIQRHKIVHRDVKPGNILLTRDGTAKLSDFGFVKSALDDRLFKAGFVLGTPDYISPEQATGQRDIDYRSDLYSLGASFYHMVTGRTPFTGAGSDVLRQHVRDEPPPVRSVNSAIPEGVAEIINRMMAKDPDDRYIDFGELFGDLELVRVGELPSSRRLAVGRTAIVRAFEAEKLKLARMEEERKDLADDMRRLRVWVWAGWAMATILLALFLVMVYVTTQN